jgi:hypothetical protein
MHGDLTLENADEAGSTFTLTLPVAAEAGTKAPVDAPDAPAQSAALTS